MPNSFRAAVFAAAIVTLPHCLGCNHSGTLQFKSRLADSDEQPSEPSAVILAPRDGDVISVDVYQDLQFVVDGELNGSKLWVVIKDEYSHFIQNPPPARNPRTGEFTQRNLRLATPGRWEILIVNATRSADRVFEDAVRRGDFAMARLPDGATTLDCVVVERQ